MSGSAQTEWLHRLAAESENLSAVLQWLIDVRRFDDAARMSWELYLYGWLAGMLGEQQMRMSELLDLAEREGVALSAWTEAVARYYTYAIQFWQHADRDVLPGLERSTELFEEAGDPAGAALARVSLGLALLARPSGPEVERAHEVLTRAIDGFASVDDRWGEAMALVTLGRLDLMTGAVDAASERFERSLQLASERREQLGIVIARHHRGWARFVRGDIDGADADFRAGIEASRTLEHDEGIAYGLEGRAAVAASRGDGEEAGFLLGAARTVRRRMGLSDYGQLTLYQPTIDALRAAGHGDELDAGYARGCALTPREVRDGVAD